MKKKCSFKFKIIVYIYQILVVLLIIVNFVKLNCGDYVYIGEVVNYFVVKMFVNIWKMYLINFI